MSNLSVGQIIVDAQRMASRVKDLDTLGSALLEEAESNNRLVESLRQFQDDIESLNRISNNKTNADMVNRIQQQNVNSSEILKENRELKICIEDYERAMELMMQKYREHTVSKVLETKMNFKEAYNERLWQIIREQRDKINEMAAVMQRAASVDDDTVQRDLQLISRLRLENETLRELLQISKQFGSAQRPIRENEHLLEEKAVQTETDDSADDLSLSGASVENMNNNTVIQVLNSDGANSASQCNSPSSNASTAIASISTVISTNVAVAPTATAVTDNAIVHDNNNGPEAAENGNSLPSTVEPKSNESTHAEKGGEASTAPEKASAVTVDAAAAKDVSTT